MESSPSPGVSGWKLVGGTLTGTPAAACSGANDITIAVKGGDNNPWWTEKHGIAYIGPPVPPATTSAGWTLQAWQGPLTNVP